MPARFSKLHESVLHAESEAKQVCKLAWVLGPAMESALCKQGLSRFPNIVIRVLSCVSCFVAASCLVFCFQGWITPKRCSRSRRHVVFVDHVLVRVAVVWSVAMSWYPAFLRMGITKAWEEKGDRSVLCTSSLLFRSPFLPEA